MRGRSWLAVSILLAMAYVGYVLWSKFARVLGAPPLKLSETQEFLLFLAAIVAFVGQVIVEERRRPPAPHDEGGAA